MTECSSQLAGCGGLANPTLLIEHGDDFSQRLDFHCYSLRFCGLSPILCL
jgi:hypothetical protein